MKEIKVIYHQFSVACAILTTGPWAISFFSETVPFKKHICAKL